MKRLSTLNAMYSFGVGSNFSGLGNFLRVIHNRNIVMAAGIISIAKQKEYLSKVVPDVLKSITTYNKVGPKKAPIWSIISIIAKLFPWPIWKEAKEVTVSFAGFFIALPIRWITNSKQAAIQPCSPTNANDGNATQPNAPKTNPVEVALQQQALGLQLKQIEAQNKLANAETTKGICLRFIHKGLRSN